MLAGCSAALALSLLSFAAAPGLEDANADTGASISAAEASAALDRVQALIAGTSAEPPRELTIALRDLAVALPVLKGQQRESAQALLARPTDGVGDPAGDGYTAPPADFRSSCSAGFCAHWVVSTADAPDPTDATPANGIPDFVDEVLAAAETSATVQNVDLGWVTPRSDGVIGGNSKTDIYLKDIGNSGLFGYAAPDPGQGAKRKQFAYLVIDNDYRAGQYAGYASPADPMRVTVAHEYNHVIQFAYDTFQESWLFESTATFIEDLVFPEIDDYVQTFVGAFTESPRTPITDPNTDKIYGSAVLHHFLANRFGPETTRDAWASSTDTKPKDFGIGALALVLKQEGSSFSRQFARFAAATAEWKATDVFPDTYPDVRRKGKLRVDRRKRTRLDHTAYVLYDVPVGGFADVSGNADLKLTVKTSRKARSGLALIGRKGSAAGGKVVRELKYLNRGGRGSVKLKNVKRFDRITAVAVNADGRANNDGAFGFDYPRDDVRYTAKLKLR
ncbi:MAG: MXAN_6640 family putative metalloprotease [Solirubrobacterales bacterium]